MSNAQQSEDANIILGIKNSLSRNSKYMYYDGIEYKASQDVTETRAEALEFKVACGTYFDVSDYLILKEVHNLGVTNVSTLLKRIIIEKRRNPKKAYPDYNYQGLMNRMRFLVRQGLLFSFEYIDTYKRSIFVFCCTMYGWRLYKNKLNSPDVYDKNIIFKAETEVFKRLASSAVAYAFAYSKACNSVIINDTITYGDKKRGYVYARTVLENDDKTLYLIEPVYFSVDTRLVSEEENINHIETRLSIITEMYQHLCEKQRVKVVFCVENYNGLTKLLNIIKNRDIEFYCNNCYFTSENVLFDSKDVLSRSFLKLIIKDSKYLFTLAKDIE